MEIIQFNNNHIEQAMLIARDNYELERNYVNILPQVDVLPDLTTFADNKLGVAAFEHGKMIGYMCAYYPQEDAFGTTNVKGTFSPIHAHGVIGENKDKLYSLLYQAAASVWVKEGIVSHAIALYAHDKMSINSFFYNGFGLRCIDAIRPMESISIITSSIEYDFSELSKAEWGSLTVLQNGLINHLGSSPAFMKFPCMSEEEFVNRQSEEIRFFAAKIKDECVAYIKIGLDGENFVCDDNSMLNICGAFCKPEYRGTGLYNNLLAYVIKVLKKEGYTRLGVDCESFNPTARGFWLKHFTEYTNSVVRRIDEKAAW